jgi:hypothetical protein
MTRDNLGAATFARLYSIGVATAVDLGGHSYQFGRLGQLERLAATGEGTHIEPTAPRAAFLFAANATIAGP